MLDQVFLPQSVGTKEKHMSRSEKYSHLPTSQIVDWLGKADFVPVRAVETKVRKADKQGFQKHMIRFRHMETTGLMGESLPEVVVINSHDGTCGLQMWAGIFRMVCSNGIVAASVTYKKVSIPHRGELEGKVIDASYRVINDAKRALIGVQEWGKIELSRKDQLDFAARGLIARYGELKDSPVEPYQILQVNRPEDAKVDLWTTFNVVQENLIRGGIAGYNRVDDNGLNIRRTVRPIRGVGQNVELNTDLWQIAEDYAIAA